MDERQPGDFLLALVLLVGSLFLLVHTVAVSREFPLTSVGPYTWPFVSLLILTALAATLLLSSVPGAKARNTKEPQQGEEAQRKTAHAPVSITERHGSLLLMVATTALVWSLPIVGFAVATVVWFPLAILLLGHVRPWLVVGSSAVFYLFTYGVFVAWLGLSLPRGTGIFSQISRWLGI